MRNKYVLMLIALLSLTVSFYGFIYEHGSIPAHSAGYGLIIGRAVGFLLFPLIIYIVVSFIARKRETEPRIKGWMIGVWIFFVYFSYIYELIHAA